MRTLLLSFYPAVDRVSVFAILASASTITCTLKLDLGQLKATQLDFVSVSLFTQACKQAV